MIYGYARVSTDGQSLDAQVKQLRAAGAEKVLNTLATITAKGAGFRSLHDTWADTTTAHGRLMLGASVMIYPAIGLAIPGLIDALVTVAAVLWI